MILTYSIIIPMAVQKEPISYGLTTMVHRVLSWSIDKKAHMYDIIILAYLILCDCYHGNGNIFPYITAILSNISANKANTYIAFDNRVMGYAGVVMAIGHNKLIIHYYVKPQVGLKINYTRSSSES